MKKKKHAVWAAFIMIWLFIPSIPATAQDGAVETLDKIGNMIFTVKDYIETLSNSELGEREVLEFLAGRGTSDRDLDAGCAAMVEEMSPGSAVEQYRLLYSGFFDGAPPVELVREVRDRLSTDGYSALTEEEKWGGRIVWFDNVPPGEPWTKRYIFIINDGWQRFLSDIFSFGSMEGTFCFAKVEKL